MTRRSDRLARRVKRQMDRREGGAITYRHVSLLTGTDPAPNPPRYAALVVNGNPAGGAVTLGIRGTPLVGRFVAGDILAIGDLILTVAADAIAASNAATVTITAPLASALTDGAAVTPRWLNELAIPAEIQGLGERLPDGTLIEARDLFVMVAHAALRARPRSSDVVVMPDGDTRQVVTATPVLVDGAPVRWRLQVR